MGRQAHCAVISAFNTNLDLVRVQRKLPLQNNELFFLLLELQLTMLSSSVTNTSSIPKPVQLLGTLQIISCNIFYSFIHTSFPILYTSSTFIQLVWAWSVPPVCLPVSLSVSLSLSIHTLASVSLAVARNLALSSSSSQCI